MKTNQKGSVAIWIIVLIILVAAGGYYWYSMNTTDSYQTPVAINQLTQTYPQQTTQTQQNTNTQPQTANPNVGIISTPATCSDGAKNPPHCNSDTAPSPSTTTPVITAFSSPSNMSNSFKVGETVTVNGKNLDDCSNAQDCSVSVYIGSTKISPKIPTADSSLSFVVPQLSAGIYEMYILDGARIEESNNVQVTIMSR